MLELDAFVLGKGKAPAQTVGAFLSGGVSHFGRVEPTYARGISEADLRGLFPAEITSVLQKGLVNFDSKISGFSASDAVLTGPETRTSSPVRIVRNPDSFEAVGATPEELSAPPRTAFAAPKRYSKSTYKFTHGKRRISPCVLKNHGE